MCTRAQEHAGSDLGSATRFGEGLLYGVVCMAAEPVRLRGKLADTASRRHSGAWRATPCIHASQGNKVGD